MKIAIPVDETKSNVCVSFARAPFFLFEEEGNVEILENEAAQAQGGAGLKAAQFLVDQNADVLITVRCGENAAKVLKMAEMEVYKSQGDNALEQVSMLKEGKLEKLTKFHAGYHGLR